MKISDKAKQFDEDIKQVLLKWAYKMDADENLYSACFNSSAYSRRDYSSY